MSRPRGDKRSVKDIGQKKAEVIKVMEENNLPPVASQELADAVALSRDTLWRYLKSMNFEFIDKNPVAYAELKTKLLENIAEKMDQLEAGTMEPDVANAWKGLVSEFAKIGGFNAETRHLRMNLNANADPATTTRTWQRSIYELRNIPEAKLNEFWARSKDLIDELAEPPEMPFARKELTDGNH